MSFPLTKLIGVQQRRVICHSGVAMAGLLRPNRSFSTKVDDDDNKKIGLVPGSALIDAIAKDEEVGISKKAASAAMKKLVETISEELKNGNSVRITGLGTFHSRVSKARRIKNPAVHSAYMSDADKGKLKETIDVPEKNRVTFKASITLKDLVNEK